jgi:ATP synthase protein I
MGRQSEPRPNAAIARPRLGKLYLALVLLLGIVCAGLAIIDAALAYSALCGGAIWLLPNLYYARQAFRFSGARAAPQVARALYLGEAGKFALTAVAFGMVFAAIEPLNAPALWAAYIGMMILGTVLGHRAVAARS